MKILQPHGWKKPAGYANGVQASGTMVFVAGQVGWNADEVIVSDDFALQVRQALENVVAVLHVAGAAPKDIVRLTWFVASVDEYSGARHEVGEAYREVMGAHYPAMTLVQVAALLEPGAKVEIEATAVIADR